MPKNSEQKVSKVTAGKRAEFLQRLEEGDTVQAIADAMGIRRQSFYRHRQANEAFRNAWIDAALIGAKIKLAELEKEADRRAVEGWLEPAFHHGKKIGEVRRFSDRLLILRLKATAKRAGDDAYVERSDVTSTGERVPTGLVVLGQPETDEAAWHKKYSNAY